jgi:hypothetical protein
MNGKNFYSQMTEIDVKEQPIQQSARGRTKCRHVHPMGTVTHMQAAEFHST